MTPASSCVATVVALERVAELAAAMVAHPPGSAAGERESREVRKSERERGCGGDAAP